VGSSGLQERHAARSQVKRGSPSTHPILRDELRAFRRLQREHEPKSPYVFTSERGAPFTSAGFARMIERGDEARLGFKAHPHMRRHAFGYALANRGHDTRALQAYLGHRNIPHTVRSTKLSPTWRQVQYNPLTERCFPLSHQIFDMKVETLCLSVAYEFKAHRIYIIEITRFSTYL
jgi:integrase